MYNDSKNFEATDFVILSITFIVPISIGIYYSFISKKKPKTVSEYLVGNRNLQFFPVAMSLAASVISGSYVIGPVSEVYLYGFQYVLRIVSIVTASCCFSVLYLPPFYNLKITSTFEYLQTRFDYKVRLLGSVLFLIRTLLSMSVWIYAPAILFEQATGVDLKFLIPICSGICIFYTFGGVRGVIWADTFQMFAILLGMVSLIIIGIHNVGGVEKISEISEEGKRLHILDFNPDPRLRNSFWILMVGNSIASLTDLTSSQFVVQRCLSLSTLFRAIMVQSVITAAAHSLGCYLGLILYTAFHDCDPMSENSISKPDQLLLHYIMNLKDRIPGLSSVVISISFCSALSSISSGLNSSSGVILIDFIRPISKRPITDAQGSYYMKITTIVIGVLYTGITYTLSNASNLIETTLSLNSITSGTSLGIFTLGVLLPWTNGHGAFVGGIAGGLMVAWVSIGSQIVSRGKKFVHSTLPLSTENCENSTISYANQTSGMTSESDVNEPFFLYAISFYYYTMIGALTAVIIGSVVSYFTGFNKPKDMNPKLFSPVVHKYCGSGERSREITDLTAN